MFRRILVNQINHGLLVFGKFCNSYTLSGIKTYAVNLHKSKKISKINLFYISNVQNQYTSFEIVFILIGFVLYRNNSNSAHFCLNMKYPFIIWSNVQCQCILGMKTWKLNSEIAPWPLWTTFFHACIINMFLWLFCICWFCLEFLYKSHRKKGELQSKLKFSSQIIALPYK